MADKPRMPMDPQEIARARAVGALYDVGIKQLEQPLVDWAGQVLERAWSGVTGSELQDALIPTDTGELMFAVARASDLCQRELEAPTPLTLRNLAVVGLRQLTSELERWAAEHPQ